MPDSPDSKSRPTTSSRTRALARARGAGGTTLLLVVACLLAAMTSPAPAAAVPPGSIPALGTRWFGVGANVPVVVPRCDFGCGLQRGVRGNRAEVDEMLRDMSRRGVRVVRWYLFPEDAWQVGRGADGMPTSVTPAALRDLDAAIELARRNDVFLLPVVLPDPDRVPTTWFTDPAQAAALATALRPVFARSRSERHVLGWELATGAERLLDGGAATTEQLRAHVAGLRAALRAEAPGRIAAVSPLDVSRIDGWTKLGINLYTPQATSDMTGERCAHCRTVADLVTAEGVDAPVLIGGFDAPTDAVATRRLRDFARRGYAGALAWSWRDAPRPQRPDLSTPMPDDATWRFHHAVPRSGPRSRPLNPCYGPDVAQLRCPNLRMAAPRSISLGRRGTRSILYSTNSLDSVGAGPASIHGAKGPGDTRFTMSGRQLLHRRSGRPTLIETGAKLLFKAIPGQYRYWKWNGAARMELWRLDSTGRPVERTRVGPKTVYCLRDLDRTHGWLRGAPRGRVYPACSQRLSQRSVTLGTSVGWSDVYPASYYENWVDVTGLRGCFAYVHIADPTNVIYESDEDDNASHVVVKLPWRGTNRGCPGAKPIPTIGPNGTY